MAGGTGFAPIKGILEHAFHLGVTRPLHLFWGVRAKQDLYLHELALGWEKQHANFHYTPVLSEPKAEDRWTGRRGWVHEAVVSDYPDLSGHEVYYERAAADDQRRQAGIRRARFGRGASILRFV